MIMETKLKIIDELKKNYNGIHLREISRRVNSGLPNIKRFLEILEKEKVVRKDKDANLVKFRLKEGAKTLGYLKQVNVEKFLSLSLKFKNAVSEFLEELKDKPLIALVFGSYAKGSYTKNSDVDILLVFQKVGNGTDIDNIAKRIGMRTNTKISPVYVDYNNFEKNFLNKNHEFSKEIRQSVIVVVGVEYYYHILWEFLK